MTMSLKKGMTRLVLSGLLCLCLANPVQAGWFDWISSAAQYVLTNVSLLKDKLGISNSTLVVGAVAGIMCWKLNADKNNQKKLLNNILKKNSTESEEASAQLKEDSPQIEQGVQTIKSLTIKNQCIQEQKDELEIHNHVQEWFFNVQNQENIKLLKVAQAQKKAQEEQIKKDQEENKRLLAEKNALQKQQALLLRNPACTPAAFDHIFAKAGIVDPETGKISYDKVRDFSVSSIGIDLLGKDENGRTFAIGQCRLEGSSLDLDSSVVLVSKGCEPNKDFKHGKAYSFVSYTIRPELAQKDPDKKMLLVVAHGTYSNDSSYGFDFNDQQTQVIVNFAKALSLAHEKTVEVVSFQWSGKLDEDARQEGASILAAEVVEKINAYKNRANKELIIYTLAHSHGCNLTNVAAREVYKKTGKDIDIGIHLASPDTQIMNDKEFDVLHFKKLYLFYGLLDGTQFLGSVESMRNMNRKYSYTYLDTHAQKGNIWVNQNNKYYNIRVMREFDNNLSEVTHGSIKIPTITNLPGILHAIDSYYSTNSDFDIITKVGGLEYPTVVIAENTQNFASQYYPNGNAPCINKALSLIHKEIAFGKYNKSREIFSHAKDFKNWGLFNLSTAQMICREYLYDAASAKADAAYVQAALGDQQ